MASLNFNIPHNLSQEEALGRIKQLIDKLKTEQKGNISSAEENWEGNTGKFKFNAKGFDLAGKINVLPSAISIDAEVPFAVSLFKGRIKEMIEAEAAKLLA